MEVIDYKPLGTIFKPYGSRKRFMIIARAIAVSKKTGEKKQFFDYACVLYPEGLIGNQLFYYQDSEISEVVFEGFSDEENEVALSRLKPILEKADVKRPENHLDKLDDILQALKNKNDNPER